MAKAIEPEAQVFDKRVILKMGHQQFIMNSDAAYALFRSISMCERYDTAWNPDTKESEPRVKPLDEDAISISFLSEEKYAMGKVLYKAEQLSKEK